MIGRAAREALEEVLGDRVRFDHPLSRATSLRVGGPVDAFATPGSREELSRTLDVCARHRLPHWTVGAGFNTLALDERLEGVAIQLGKLRRLGERPGGCLRVEAGVPRRSTRRWC